MTEQHIGKPYPISKFTTRGDLLWRNKLFAFVRVVFLLFANTFSYTFIQIFVSQFMVSPYIYELVITFSLIQHGLVLVMQACFTSTKTQSILLP